MEFIEGNWYKTKYNNYYKFLRLENDYFYYSEKIYENNYSRGGWGGLPVVWVVFLVLEILNDLVLKEIQTYLPLNHPDLINNVNLEIHEDYIYLEKLFEKLNIK